MGVIEALKSATARLPAREISKMERLYDHASAQIDVILRDGHSEQLEHYLSLLQVSFTYVDAVPQPERDAIVSKIAQLIRKCTEVGTNDVFAPVVSSLPLSFVCSYPRSGNTLAIQLAAQTVQAQIFQAMPGSQLPFSKKVYPKTYPYTRLIKDHVARREYRDDRVAVLIRDGRDCMISLAYMILQRGRHTFTERHQLADFIRWLDHSYPFGGWAKHMGDVRFLTQFADKHVVRYEDLIAAPQAFVDLVRFLDPSCVLPDHDIAKKFELRHAIFDNVKNNAEANRFWGIGKQFSPKSMFYDWSRNRKGSSWRQSWDAEARKTFHETGATEYLIEYGYETDRDWWKD